jgi:hypothetical protein
VNGIVLSFDPHLEIANLLIETYNRFWPDCPIQFRIPFTERDPKSIFRARNVEFIPTGPDIRSTMENLLRDLPENEFIFWSTSDRYPIEMCDLPVLRAVHDFAAQQPRDIDSIKLTDLTVDGVEGKIGERRRPLLRKWLYQIRRRDQRVGETSWRKREEDTARASAFEVADQRFFRQLGNPKNGFYMPQFTTPAFLKKFFFAPALPRTYAIREFHEFLLAANFEHRSYFPNKFLVSVGESTFRGKLSAACYAQMLKLGVAPPKIDIVNDYKIYSDRAPA